MNLNIGVIGAGMIGKVHLISLKKIINENLISKPNINVKIKGIADIDENQLKILKKNNPYNIEVFTTEPENLINNKDINVIYITTPTKSHKDYFMESAEQGKSIFCEKPLAFSLADIKEMMSQEKKYGVLTQVGLVLRHCPVFWKLKQILTEHADDLGEVLSFIFRDTQEWPVGTRSHSSEWRKDPSFANAGCLFEHSIHDVDLLEYFFGDDHSLTSLFAKVRHVSPLTQNRLEDTAALTFEYKSGLVGNLMSIWNNARKDDRKIEIFFENGFIVLDGYMIYAFDKFEFLVKKKKRKYKMKEIIAEYQEKMNYKQFTPSSGPYLFEDLSFLEAIIAGKNPYPGLNLGLKAHEIIELAYKSSKEEKVVKL